MGAVTVIMYSNLFKHKSKVLFKLAVSYLQSHPH